MATTIRITRRQELVNEHVTLNDKPAAIGGYMNNYAMVICLDGSNRVEFAWETVDHIVRNCGGKFKS
jgi:hypothetical protein